MSVTSFVSMIKPKNNVKLLVYLDSKVYPKEFGIGVWPLQVIDGPRIIDMTELISIFGKIPYITIRENQYRTIYRDPMILTIDLTPRQFTTDNDSDSESHTYYKYYIDKLCLRNELKRYELLHAKANEATKEYRSKFTDHTSVDAIRDTE
mgnify:CR=1 FL=1